MSHNSYYDQAYVETRVMDALNKSDEINAHMIKKYESIISKLIDDNTRLNKEMLKTTECLNQILREESNSQRPGASLSKSGNLASRCLEELVNNPYKLD